MTFKTPAQLQQEDEARNRSAPLTDDGRPEADQRQDAIDDSTGEREPEPERRAEPRAEPERAEPVVIDRRSPSDIARAEMAERFKRDRRETEGDVPYNGNPNDPEMQYGRHGRPLDVEPEPGIDPALGSDIRDEGQQQERQPPAPKTHKLKVRGLDVEMTEEEVLRRASMVTAADSYLEEAREILDAAKGVKRDQATRTGQSHQHPDGQTGAQDDGANIDANSDGQHPDPLEAAIEEIRFGTDSKEAARNLRTVLSNEADTAADKRQITRLMSGELAKSQTVLQKFAADNPDIAKDDLASEVVLKNIYDIYTEDLVKTGIDPSQIPTDREQLANLHRFARVKNGDLVTPIEKVFEKAGQKYRAWRGGTQATQQQEQRRTAPRIDVNVDRTERRLAIPSHPTRTVAARPDANQQAAAPRDRSDIIMGMRKARGQVVGQ